MADETMTLDPATGMTRDELRRAALTVCGHATDVEDARELLAALGLTPALSAARRAG